MNSSSDTQISWIWASKDCIGPVKYGESANLIINKYNLLLNPEYGNLGRDVYEFLDGTTISVENDLIDSLNCESNFFYKDTNLIGISIEKIRQILGDEDLIDNDFEDHICHQFDEYELMVWVNKETGLADSVSCF